MLALSVQDNLKERNMVLLQPESRNISVSMERSLREMLLFPITKKLMVMNYPSSV